MALLAQHASYVPSPSSSPFSVDQGGLPSYLILGFVLIDKATNSVERDENFCPATRSDWGLPAPEQAEPSKYAEVLEEAPIVSLFRLFIQQALGLEAYLMVNAGGNKMYPAGTNVSTFDLKSSS